MTDAIVREINKWIHARCKAWGGICRTVDGQRLDWGQAATYMYYGPDWSDEDLSIVPPDVMSVLNTWDDVIPPEWFMPRWSCDACDVRANAYIEGRALCNSCANGMLHEGGSDD